MDVIYYGIVPDFFSYKHTQISKVELNLIYAEDGGVCCDGVWIADYSLV